MNSRKPPIVVCDWHCLVLLFFFMLIGLPPCHILVFVIDEVGGRFWTLHIFYILLLSSCDLFLCYVFLSVFNLLSFLQSNSLFRKVYVVHTTFSVLKASFHLPSSK